MTEKDILQYAAILTAGMLARDQESVVTPMVAVDVMCDVADALRSKLNMPKVNQDYSM